MKKILIVFGLLVATIATTKAQGMAENALGLRFSSDDGFGADISYQRKLAPNNRLELNLGMRDTRTNFKAVGLYQWVCKLEDKFNWYMGVGGGFDSGSAALFGAGVAGIEYDFDAPILISLDFRPEVGITGNFGGLNSTFALSARYQF